MLFGRRRRKRLSLAPPHRPRSRVRSQLELLESRRMLALTVNTSTDEDDAQNGTVDGPAGPNGMLSLREAINWLNKGNDDTIKLGTNVSVTEGSLPQITAAVTFDGAKFIITGSTGNGLDLKAGGTIKDLTINSFSGVQIVLEATGTIQDCFVGTNKDGTAAIGGVAGIAVLGGSSNQIKNTVVSGNSFYQIFLQGGSTTIEDCSIGTNKDGTSALGGNLGVIVHSSNNTLKKNVVSGLSGNAISINLGKENRVIGNFIGTDKKGEKKLGNGGDGVALDQAAQKNTIGGTSSSDRNIISGNSGDGVSISGSSTNDNTVEGNYIGTDVTGDKAIANGKNGVKIRNAARNNTIGGESAGERNVISGNTEVGVLITDKTPRANTVSANYIGVNHDATSALANHTGVKIDGAAENTIGGTSLAAANIISGNQMDGVLITADGAQDNSVTGNFIGSNFQDADLGNGGVGVFINGAAKNTIGSIDTGTNSIAYNRGAGIQIDGSTATENVVEGNTIVWNQEDGILIHDASDNIIGKPGSLTSNTIGGNAQHGVRITGQGATNNLVQNNDIGDEGGSGGFGGNLLSGVSIEDAADNTIGGEELGTANRVIGNAHNGVQITGGAATGNRINGNTIYNSGSLGIDLDDDEISPNVVGSSIRQNYPILTSVVAASGTDTSIQGTISGDAGPFRIEFYANDGPNAYGVSEGKYFLGAITTSAGAFTANFSTGGDQFITATATDANGNTSEFSPCRDILRDSVRFEVATPQITAYFTPHIGQRAISQALAAQICEVDHFNWIQQIVSAPAFTTYFRYLGDWNPVINADGDLQFWPPPPAPTTSLSFPLYDPIDSSTFHYGIHSTVASAEDPTHFPTGDIRVGLFKHDDFIYYINDDAATLSLYLETGDPGTSTWLKFSDGPQMPEPFNPGEKETKDFHTRLAGVKDDAAHSAVEWLGIRQTNFTWDSSSIYEVNSQKGSGSVTAYYDSVPPGTVLPPVTAGGISNVQYDLPNLENRAPTAALAGPYTISEGNSLALDASSSSDPDGDPLTFSWDLDSDGDFNDAAGVRPNLTWDELQALGIDNGPDTYQVKVRVDDGHGHVVDSIAVALTVNNKPPTATFSGPSGSVGEGVAASFSFSDLFDPSDADTTAGFTYSYDFNNDGDFTDPGEFANVAAASQSYSFSQSGTITVHGRITDQNGDVSDYRTTVTVVAAAPTGSAELAGVKATGFLNIATLKGSIVDADATRAYALTIDWGDDHVRTIDFPVGTTSFTVRHFYTSLALFHTIDVTLQTDDGGTATAQAHVRGLLGELLAFPWHNQVDAADVNQDSQVSAIDLLYVAEALNTNDNSALSADITSDLLVDTSGDGVLSAIDLLLVAERLNVLSSPALQVRPNTQPAASPDELALLQFLSEEPDFVRPSRLREQVTAIQNDLSRYLFESKGSSGLEQLESLIATSAWKHAVGRKQKSGSETILSTLLREVAGAK